MPLAAGPGKEPAQNILAFRFANGLFEPIWNRNFMDHVQIDVPEMLGLGKRSGFYEQTGACRDMVATHLFQILAFMAMEPPTSLDAAGALLCAGLMGAERDSSTRCAARLAPAVRARVTRAEHARELSQRWHAPRMLFSAARTSSAAPAPI